VISIPFHLQNEILGFEGIACGICMIVESGDLKNNDRHQKLKLEMLRNEGFEI
jgi:hypothetical protein